MENMENLTAKEQQLFQAANVKKEEKKESAALPEPETEKERLGKLKRKYSESGEKVFEVTNTFEIDDDREESFTFLLKKPKTASYERYVKTVSNSSTKANKMFVLENAVEEQKEYLSATLEDYPALGLSLAEKLLHMMGLASTTTIKKL